MALVCKKKKFTVQGYKNFLNSGFCAVFDVGNLSSVAMEIGPQPHGVVRSNTYTAMESGVQHVLDWVRLFNSGAISTQ